MVHLSRDKNSSLYKTLTHYQTTNFRLTQIESICGGGEKISVGLERVEYIVGTGENTGHQHFLFFPTMFSKIEFALERVKKIEGKKEIAGYQHFFIHIPLMYSKALFHRVMRSQDCIVIARNQQFLLFPLCFLPF